MYCDRKNAALIVGAIVATLVIYALVSIDTAATPPPPPLSPAPPPPLRPATGTKWLSEVLVNEHRLLRPREIVDRFAGGDTYIVNLGAHDGTYANGDIANELWFSGSDAYWRGFAIEGMPDLCTKFAAAIARTNASVVLTCEFALPSTIASVFETRGVPRDFAMLKLDIDSVDCPVLDAILGAGYRPRYIHMEANFDIPPPIVFAVEPSPELSREWFWQIKTPFKGFYGCSLSRIEELARQYGYSLVQASIPDAELVRNDLVPHGVATDAPTLYNRGVWPDCRRTTHFDVPGGCAYFMGLKGGANEAMRRVWQVIHERMPLDILKLTPFRLYIS